MAVGRNDVIRHKRVRNIIITNETSGKVICSDSTYASSLASRLIGLLGEREADNAAGVLLCHCSSIHTWGMAFAIDVLALDQANRVIAIRRDMGAGKFAIFSCKTRRVLEVPSRRGALTDVVIGDTLRIEDPSKF